MLHVRLSLMTPKPGEAEAVASVMDDLLRFFARQPGFVRGYRLQSADDTRDLGRVTIWQSKEAADAVAQLNHVMSRRAALMALLKDGSDLERSFHAEDASTLPASIAGKRRE